MLVPCVITCGDGQESCLSVLTHPFTLCIHLTEMLTLYLMSWFNNSNLCLRDVWLGARHVYFTLHNIMFPSFAPLHLSALPPMSCCSDSSSKPCSLACQNCPSAGLLVQEGQLPLQAQLALMPTCSKRQNIMLYRATTRQYHHNSQNRLMVFLTFSKMLIGFQKPPGITLNQPSWARSHCSRKEGAAQAKTQTRNNHIQMITTPGRQPV